MRPRHLIRPIVAVVSILIVLPLLLTAVRAQVLTPPPEQLRFQALLTEPIATPDRRSVVAGTNVMVVKDLGDRPMLRGRQPRPWDGDVAGSVRRGTREEVTGGW